MSLVNRLKTAVLALLATALFGVAPVLAAGTLPLAMAQQQDINGLPLAGCKVYFYVAGTVATPQNSYSDFGLSQNPNPILSCDQSGRVPMFWLADGLVHVRLTDSAGTQVIDTTMQVLGPSSGGGGGGGGTVDPTAIIATGDLKARYGTGPLTGFVRANGLTIGSLSSGATERANADTQVLFIYLYNADPNLVVSGGRTGNALNDFNANKTIALPDWRGNALGALADMGNTPATGLTSTYFGNDPTVLGAQGGGQSSTLVTLNLPPYTPAGSLSGNATIGQDIYNGTAFGPGVGGFFLLTGPSGTHGSPSSSNSPVTGSLVGTAQGGTSSPFTNVSPMKLATIYIKL